MICPLVRITEMERNEGENYVIQFLPRKVFVDGTTNSKPVVVPVAVIARGVPEFIPERDTYQGSLRRVEYELLDAFAHGVLQKCKNALPNMESAFHRAMAG
jgi:hypothetical protein